MGPPLDSSPELILGYYRHFISSLFDTSLHLPFPPSPVETSTPFSMTINSASTVSAATDAVKEMVSDANGVNGLNNFQATTQKPRILMAASPASGHTFPIIAIAAELVQRGYEVTFLAGEEFLEAVARAGARGIPIAPFDDDAWTIRDNIPAGPARLEFDMKHFFIKPMTSRTKDALAALEMMKAEVPDREIIILTESFFMGTLPMYLGGPLPKGFTTRPKIINIHAACYMATSCDIAPLGMVLPPDSSPEGRVRNKTLHDEMKTGLMAGCLKYLAETLEGLGAVDYQKDQSMFDTWCLSHDVTLQMCPNTIEYPISDLNPKVKFVGAIPAGPAKKTFVPPSFWEEVTCGDKKVVIVTQGTVAVDYKELVVPAMEGLAKHDDVLVVVILGKKGATLPDDIPVPDNTRVIDHLSYDAILPYSSAMVCNGGYGGFIHGVVNGVPMIMGGESEDKPEVSARGEWAGIAVNLKTARPSAGQVAEAVGKILGDDKYKKRIMEIKKENEEMKAMDAIEKTILEMAAQS